MAEKMITLGQGGICASARFIPTSPKETVATKLFDEFGPKYADRNGGYTRIVTGPAAAPTAEMAIIELV